MRKLDVVAGADEFFARWAHRESNTVPISYEAVFGIIDKDKNIRGAFMFNNYNHSDIECHFYGPGALNRYIFREIMLRALIIFKVNRMTVKTRKASMARGVQKLGAIYEGAQRRFYGPTDSEEHTAKVFVFYRERMEAIAGMSKNVSESLST